MLSFRGSEKDNQSLISVKFIFLNLYLTIKIADKTSGF